MLLSIVVAGTTSGIAWLLDPAVKKIFIDQDKTYALFIPILIVLIMLFSIFFLLTDQVWSFVIKKIIQIGSSL